MGRVDIGEALELRDAEETYGPNINPENRAIASKNNDFRA